MDLAPAFQKAFERSELRARHRAVTAASGKLGGPSADPSALYRAGDSCAHSGRRLFSCHYGSRGRRSLGIPQGIRHASRRAGIQPAQPTPSETPRPRAGSHPASPRQSQHRKVLRRMDPPVHPLPRETASPGDGGARGHTLPELPGRSGQGRILNSEPGAERSPVPNIVTFWTKTYPGSRMSSGPRARSVFPSF